ncbi:MAG: hypothetical protein KJ626_05255 [Verrucomicrobia bacterium]|nr:hypothetical protein [Verrucomicrobiota bacterium]
MKSVLRKALRLGVVFVLAAFVASAAPVHDGSIEAEVSFPAPSVVQSADGLVNVAIEGLSYPGKPARPELPQDSLLYALPPDADLSSVTVTAEPISQTELALPGKVRPGAPMRVSAEGSAVYGDAEEVVDGFDIAVYGTDALYPVTTASIVDFPKMRKWQMVRIQVNPVSYNPVQNILRYSENIRLTINYNTVAADQQQTLSTAAAADNVLDDLALELISNDGQAAAWYVSDETPQDETAASASYIIMTTDEIFEQTRDNGQRTLYGLVPHKESMGWNVHVVTETSVDGSSGAAGWNEVTGQSPNTAADRIRKWLQNNYVSLNIQYVLLVGNPDPNSGDLPMKNCRDNLSDSYVYPTDAYYGDLSGNWDLNGDGVFGVSGSDDGVGGVDFTPEVLVGRIPVYQSHADWKDTLKSIAEKTIAYETSTYIPWRKKALLPESWSDEYTDGAYLAENLKTHVLNPNGYSSYTMYQQGHAPNHPEFDSVFTSNGELRGDRVVDHWEDNTYGTVLWWAHGWSQGAAVHYDGTLLSSDQCPRLNDSQPAVVFMVSCTCGMPSSDRNLGYSILKNGAIANVCGANVTWYYHCSWSPSDSLGMNASMGYNFNRRVVDLDQSFGQAHFLVKASAPGWRHNHLSFNLYGDPSLKLSSHAVDTDGDGMPDYWENKYGLNPYHSSDANGDLDSDGLSNVNEYFRHTVPTDPDTDDDGMDDGWEVDYQFNPTDASDRTGDADNDGLLNYEEHFYQTNPRNADTDSDGMPDGWEALYSLNPRSAADASSDADGDGLSNLTEYQLGTNPTSTDSDGDSMPDAWEVQEGFDPANPADGALDADSDGLNNAAEHAAGTDPHFADTDLDGIADGDDGDPLNPDFDQVMIDSDHLGFIRKESYYGTAYNWFTNTCQWQDEQYYEDRGFAGFDVSVIPADSRILNAVLVYNATEQDPYTTQAQTKIVPLGNLDPLSGDQQEIWESIEAGPGLQVPALSEFPVSSTDDEFLVLNSAIKNDLKVRLQAGTWSLGFGYTAFSARNYQLSNVAVVVTYDTNTSFKSDYNWMTAAGTFNGWDQLASNMTLVADHVWQFDVNLANQSAVRFKFVAEGNWGVNWGEDNQGDFDAPISGNAELGFYGDVVVNGTLDGAYRFTFNEQTGAYTLEEVPQQDSDNDGMPDAWESAHGLNPYNASDASGNPDGDLFTNLQEYQNGTDPNVWDAPLSNYDSMTVAGTFNGWDEELDNMELVDHYTWQWEGMLSNQQAVRFKFVANSSWSINWGDANQSDQSVPMNDYADMGDYSDILVSHALDGKYRFTFNESSLHYEVEEVPLQDTDNDGIPDDWEDQYGLNKSDPSDAAEDPDADGLTNLDEYQLGTHPFRADTDFDGIDDGIDADPVTPAFDQVTLSPALMGMLSSGHSSPLSGVWMPGVCQWGLDQWNAYFGQVYFDVSQIPGGAKIKNAVVVYDGSIVASWNPTTLIGMGSLDPTVDDDACTVQMRNGVPLQTVTNGQYATGSAGMVLPLNTNVQADIAAGLSSDTWGLGIGYTHAGATGITSISNVSLVVTYDSFVSDYDAMTAAGTFNGWDQTLDNMELIADHVWQYDHTFNNEVNVRFKFTANSSWNVNWGETDQWQFNPPIYGTAEQTGSDILIFSTLTGVYRFTFNEQTREFSFQEVGGGTGLEGIYNVHHWPANGQLTDQDSLGVYCESHPIGEGVSAEVLYSTDDGVTWSTAPMSDTGVYGANDGWGAVLGTFSAGTQIDYYVQVTDTEGTVHTENNGGIYYTAIVKGNGTPLEWIGNVYHWPWNGEIDSWDDLYANIESFPQGAAVSARVVYTDDGAVTWYSESMEIGTPVGNNDHWYVNLGNFSSGTHVEYAIEVIDGIGNSWWDSDYGNNHHAWVN